MTTESPEVKEFRRRQLQGLGKPIDSWLESKVRHIRVNKKVYKSPNWIAFEDFLFTFIREKLTVDWYESELKKALVARHPIMQWHDRLSNFQREQAQKNNNSTSVVQHFEPTGAIKGILNLAYYLYLCDHHNVLEERMLGRLKNRINFEGAMYELFVISSFLKGGFLVELEDESDSTNSHCEFTATHTVTGRKFSVEAKARTLSSKRSGHGETPRIKDKLIEALKKSAQHERIVFIELNRAEYAVNGIPPAWMTQIEKDFDDAENEFATLVEGNPAAYMFVTNQSFMHWLDDGPKPPLQAATGHNIKDFPFNRGPATMEMIVASRKKHIELHNLLDSLTRNGVPSTFDDQTPEEFFGVISRPIVGQSCLLPGENGLLVQAELVHGTVDEVNGNLWGQFRTERGMQMLTVPLSEHHMNAYFRSPETFLGVFSQTPTTLSSPYNCYEFIFNTYSKSTKEFFIENSKMWLPQQYLESLSHDELVENYCLNIASTMWADAHPEKIAPFA
jgi:hypothetical protein